MLTLLPIQFLALFAYFLLRVCIGVIILHFGIKLWFSADRPPGAFVFAGVATITGMQLLLGLATQLAALTLLVLSLVILCLPNSRIRSQLPDTSFWFLAGGVAISLFITGAGVFAIDLPI